MSLAAARFDPELHLRAPNTTELQAADQKIWYRIFELVNTRGIRRSAQ